MKKRKLVLTSILGSGFLALSMFTIKPTAACALSNPSGVAFENSYNDISNYSLYHP